MAPIFVDSSGQNRILVVKGANDRLTPADVDAAAEVLSRADVIVLQLEIPLETVYHTLRFARARGIPRDPESGAGPTDRHAGSRERRLRRSKRNRGGSAEWNRGSRSRTRRANVRERCFKAGLRRVIITLGAQGASSRVGRRNDACAAVRGSACRYLGRRRRVHRKPGMFPGGRIRRGGGHRAGQCLCRAFDALCGNAKILRDSGTISSMFGIQIILRSSVAPRSGREIAPLQCM